MSAPVRIYFAIDSYSSGFDAAFDFLGFRLVTVTDFSSGLAVNPVSMLIDLDCSTTGT